MKFKVFELECNGLKFRIEEDLPDIGAYLYIYQNNRCIKDYLQDSIEVCKNIAFEEYGVPIENWNP